MLRVSTQLKNLLLSGLQVHLGFVLAILRDLQIFFRQCAVRVQVPRACQRFSGEDFIRTGLLIISSRASQIRTGNYQELLALLHVVAQPHLQFDGTARSH